MTNIKLGNVLPFPDVKPDKEQALKVLEEAAEVFCEWQICGGYLEEQSAVDCITGEIADTIQACCNLAASLGVTDMTAHLARCEERNRERGRYDSL